MLSRYQSLKSQYTADIKRLTFIVEGEVEYQIIPRVSKCPFCDGKIATHNHQSYIEASRGELARIVAQIDGLEAAEADVKAELVEIESELTILRAKREDIESLISEQLCPKADDLREMLNNYRAFIRLKHEMDVIDSFSDSWTTDLRELPEETGVTLQYHPKEYFDEAFLSTMDTLAKEILNECNYENLTSARFNLSDFDIEVNGGKKATNHGKGYCAYAVAHMKLAMTLKETGYSFSPNHRLQVYLANSLEAGDGIALSEQVPDPLLQESNYAALVRNSKINVIWGNPPYRTDSVNKGQWIMHLMEDYKKEPGQDPRRSRSRLALCRR